MMTKIVRTLFNNYYLILGIIIGLFMNLTFIEFDCTEKLSLQSQEYNYSTLKAVIKINNVTRGVITKKPIPVRPRYYSTELGIREKLFLGILTSEERLELQSVHLNGTVFGLVDKIKFFMMAPRRTKTYNTSYAHLVGFTDTHQKLWPFQVIKYIIDNFLQDYDFYYIANDFNYINARLLGEIVNGISVQDHIYVGSTVYDATYCDLDGGILFSHSVMQRMKDNIEWCVTNAATSDHSENIGRCVYHSTKLECQNDLKVGVKYASYKMKSFDFAKKFSQVKHLEDFKSAVSVYPVSGKDQFYLLHSYFSKLELEKTARKISKVTNELSSWPPGERAPTVPATRFDLARRVYFNWTHVFAPDDFTNVRVHTQSEIIDLGNVLNKVLSEVKVSYPHLKFVRLMNGYKVFDLGRGLDYTLDLVFESKENDEQTFKRYEVSKPLGNAEFITAPYVTENKKVTVLVAVEEPTVSKAKTFLDQFDAHMLQQKDKLLLVLVFLYQYSTPNKGPDDPFAELKSMAVKLSDKYRSEETKVAWVSIRLSNFTRPVILQEFPLLRFPIVELSLSKVGVESLVLLLSTECVVTIDFLNRVRMNTVNGFQIFSVIPFQLYDPYVAKYNHSSSLELSKNTGHFDKDSFEFLSFYGRDYIYARKRSKHIVPLVRNDNDIEQFLSIKIEDLNIFDMFLRYSKTNLHLLRAPDSNLKVKFCKQFSFGRRNVFLGTRTQLAQTILFDEL